jgi:mannosyl-3-phosphoglycerate phosphatase family protein
MSVGTVAYIVSTDLDGTLLDHYSYSFEAARDGLARCQQLGVPVVINTSKTYAEVVDLQSALKIDAPVIVENGSALVAVEHHWSKSHPTLSPDLETRADGAQQVVFGVDRSLIISFIDQVRTKTGWGFEGFNDWSATQIVQHTGLDLESAKQAALKEFSEPLIWHDSLLALEQFEELAKLAGLRILKGGRFYHLQGATDKAQPLKWMQQFGSSALATMPESNCLPKLICLGDSDNDIAMLNAADYPVCVRSPITGFPRVSNQAKVFYTKGVGPVGWSEAILSIFS